jgi:hypothetical protein
MGICEKQVWMAPSSRCRSNCVKEFVKEHYLFVGIGGKPPLEAHKNLGPLVPTTEGVSPSFDFANVKETSEWITWPVLQIEQNYTSTVFVSWQVHAMMTGFAIH